MSPGRRTLHCNCDCLIPLSPFSRSRRSGVRRRGKSAPFPSPVQPRGGSAVGEPARARRPRPYDGDPAPFREDKGGKALPSLLLTASEASLREKGRAGDGMRQRRPRAETGGTAPSPVPPRPKGAGLQGTKPAGFHDTGARTSAPFTGLRFACSPVLQRRALARRCGPARPNSPAASLKKRKGPGGWERLARAPFPDNSR